MWWFALRKPARATNATAGPFPVDFGAGFTTKQITVIGPYL